MPIKSWIKTWENKLKLGKEGQTAVLSGVATFRMGKEIGGPITIHVDLQGTEISPGTMTKNERDEQGWFQDKITVKMNIERHPDYRRTDDSPGTTPIGISTTSAVTVNYGGAAGGGFFGPLPMGTVSLTGGVSNTNSYSVHLPDFAVSVDNDSHTILHTYYMTNHSKGKYDHPSDLWVNIADVFEALKGPEVGVPPKLASHSFPIVSQAVWQATHTRESNETLLLDIKITQHLTWVRVTRPFVEDQITSWTSTNTFTLTEKIPLHELKQTRPVEVL